MKITSPVQPTFRGVDKKARDREPSRRVRVVNADGAVFTVCNEMLVRRYMLAPNAEIIRTHGGRVVAVKLLSVGDDTRHLGDCRGSSTVTTYQEPIPTMTGISRITQHKAARV
jgi:hypothetical protein